jgi:dolichyl-phosphate-mannose--protein O-mannosyl transferase
MIWYLGTLSVVGYSALLVFYLIFQAQIHLIGNPMIWYLGTLSVVGYSALLVFQLILTQNKEVIGHLGCQTQF